ncbi:hypothetical protein [Treponema phagedenis]|uniref:hypothetical protein n=1 Tax=Treponema phagedenis TaxID=162 RepID=UPI0011E7DCEC|nr:hypothetical protein [Treponema phagedenis]QEJ94050.1 hypothetical protein FUT79_01675 [Treponema phagedenis]QEK01940.1 hypothetical protein FUT84_12735 [Treponema phagedenis]QEK07052.1 hypothetical protein FUT80_10215 [Treponema phagedenis]QSH95329.1 hypothetical protein C5O78_09925 [Treponema phagedenis]
MINTYNETGLHKALKNHFTDKNGQQERPVEGFICDIVQESGAIFEIQTSGLVRLRAKLEKLLPLYPVTVVYPISLTTYIEMLNADGSRRSYRKSPKHGSFFQIYREIAPLYYLFEHKNFSLIIAYITSETIKIDDKKGRSKYYNPRIIDKNLLTIHEVEEIHGKQSFTQPLFQKLPDIFCSADIKKIGAEKHYSYVLWFLKKIQAIEFYEKKGRMHYYKKKPTP